MKFSSTSTQYSNAFHYACTFDSDNLPFNIETTNTFHFVQLSFNYKTMFGGERNVYFVSPHDEIILLSKSKLENSSRHEQVNIKLYTDLGTEMKFYKSLDLVANYFNYLADQSDFIPFEYYRDGQGVYVIDTTRTKVLKLLLTSSESSERAEFKHKIKQVVTGPLANSFILLLENNEIWDATILTAVRELSLPKNIRCASAFNSGFIFVDQNNKLYINEQGNHVQQGLGQVDEHMYVRTMLEDKHEIVDIQSGFYHVILRSKEGKVFAAGFDNMNQCTFGLKNNSGVDNLTQVPFEYGNCIQMGGFSRGEYLMNSKNEIYFIAEMFSTFTGNNSDFTFVHKLDLDELNSRTLEMKNQPKFNDVVNTGWQCCIYHNFNKISAKSINLMNRLWDNANNLKLTDTCVITNDGY